MIQQVLLLAMACFALAAFAGALPSAAAAAVPVFWSHRARTGVHVEPPEVAVIPGTNVPLPTDYEDYARGRKPWRLFPGAAPGERHAAVEPGPGLPAFDPADLAASAEVWTNATATDLLGQMCAPGGVPKAHYFYNVWDPEVIPFLVDRNDSRSTDAAVVIAPGGGGVHLAWEGEGISPAQWFNSLGISAFVLKYRIPDRSMHLPVADAQRALSLVRTRAADLGLNASRIGFMGSSAGGQLGISLATTVDRVYKRIDAVDDLPHHPDFVLLLYPGIPLGELDLTGGSRMPRTFLAFSDNDPCCDPAITRLFVGFLRFNMVQPLQVEEFEQGGHGWGDCNFFPFLKRLPCCHWRDSAADFLRREVLRQ